MKTSLMTFSMMRDGFVKTIDADLLARIIKEGGYEEADIMEFEFRLYGEDALLSALQKYGIRLGCLITGLPFYTAPDQVEGGIRQALALAKKAGTRYLMIVPGQNDAADAAACEKLGREGILRLTAEHFRKAVELAEPEGIQVIFENTPHAMKPLAAVEDVKWVLDAVPGLGLAFDTGNFRVADVHADELAAYELLKDRISRFHLKEVRFGDFPDGEKCVNGQAIKAVLTGSGVIPMEELIRRSLADGYDGTYAVEYAAPADSHGAAHISCVRTYLDVITAMEKKTFLRCPQSDFPGLTKKVSRIFFGTAAMPMMMGANAEILFDLAMAFGINAIDCARGYGNAEETLGKWMKARDNREDVVVLTKCGNAGPGGSVHIDRKVIEEELSTSLEKLQTSYIDIFLLHRDDPKTPVSEFIETLNEAKAAGKIRVFGVSNWTHTRIMEANVYAEAHGLTGFTVSSPNYGLTRQVDDPWGGECVTIAGPENAEARAWYTANQMPVIAYSSLGRGFMSGKFRSFDYDAAKKVLDPFATKGYLSEDNMRRLAAAERYAAEHALSVPQTAMRFVLSSDMNVFAAATMSGFRRVLENVIAANERMQPEEWKALDAIE